MVSKPKKPQSVAVTPTSTLRQDAASTVVSKSNDGKSVTKSQSANTSHDLRASSIQAMADEKRQVSQPRQAVDVPVDSDVKKMFQTGVLTGQEQSVDSSLGGGASSANPPQPNPSVASDNRSAFAETFMPSEEVGAQRRMDAFGNSSPQVATAAVVAGAGVAAVSGAAAFAWLVGRAASVGMVTSQTAVNQLSRVGTSGLGKAAMSSAEKFATNSASRATTGVWLAKLASRSVSPQVVAGSLVSIIGSYPFAGFIKEEALQTLSMGTRSALESNDFVGAEESIKLSHEILDPELWENIISKVPFANVVAQLQNFYEAARLKVDIDSRLVADLKKKTESGETDESYWQRVQDERDARDAERRASDEAYYVQVEKNRAAAKASERRADEKYWSKILENKNKYSDSQSSYQDKYWDGYYKAVENMRQDNSPSKLTFGLL